MRYSKIVVALLIACAAISFVIVAYYVDRYEQTQRNSNTQTAREALNQLSYSEREYLNIRDQLFSIISLLSHGQSTYDYVLNPTPKNRQQFQDLFHSVANSQKWFNKIYFIDEQGMEKIHIDERLNDIRRDKPETLRDHSQQPFFHYAQSLGDDEVGSWGGDLDDNTDIHIQAYTPMVRVITPITVLGMRKGYIVANIDVSILAGKLNYSPELDLTPGIVGESGYFVLARHQDEEDLHHQRITTQSCFDLSNQFPKTWDAMKKGKSDYFLEQRHLLVFKSVDMFSRQKIHLAICLTPQQLASRAERDLNDLVKEGFFVFTIMLLFALPTAFMAFHYHRRNIDSKLARAALDGMSAVMISNKTHQVIMVNKEFELMVGLSSDEVRGRNALKTLLSHNGMDFILDVLEQVAEQNVWEGEVECITPEGQILTTIMRIQAIIEAGKVSYYITSIVDISERKVLENKLRDLSEKDSLTHLWNRRKFERELNVQSQLVDRYVDEYKVCLSLIDIDYFKRVNDELGHDQGDRVIVRVAQVLLEQLRTTDFLARIGGEEFAVIMPHTSADESERVVERLRKAIELDESLPVTISAGISDLSKDSTRSYKCADIALYQSKTQGRNQVSFCHTSEDLA